MSMDQNNLTPEDSLAIMSKAISNFKMNYRESSMIFLHWGWILTFASISNFIVLRLFHDKQGLYSLGTWAVFIMIGFIRQYFLLRKINRNKKVYSYLDTYLNKLWQVAAASFLVGTLVCIKLDLTPPPIMLLIAGLATTTTGLIIKFSPLIIGGIAFFVFSFASTFVTNEYLALIVAAALVCGYLIPGYFLKAAKEE